MLSFLHFKFLRQRRTSRPSPRATLEMVQVFLMHLGLAAMVMVDAVSTSLNNEIPSFKFPNFDYQKLTTDNTPINVLNALKKDGVVSFTNVPMFSQARASYLKLAATCTVSAQEVNADFLLQKTLTDGTKRYTIGAASGKNADASAAQTDMTCPGYKILYDEFSSLLEMVVLTVATTLDATTFTTKDGYGQNITSRKLITDAVRLDHFHAYETPSLHDRRLQSTSSVTQMTSEKEFALELHTDSGLFIVFATPSFYKVNNNGRKSTIESAGYVDDAESGLFVQRQDGQLVRPILNLDQVTLMVGTGYNEWVDTSEQLPAVPHAMQMPSMETTAIQRLLRTWFGKMTLLPLYQRMLQPTFFDEYANSTLSPTHHDTRQLLGCAEIITSGPSNCTIFTNCTSKKGNSSDCDVCNDYTNYHKCKKKCECTRTAGKICWMNCVPGDHCPNSTAL